MFPRPLIATVSSRNVVLKRFRYRSRVSKTSRVGCTSGTSSLSSSRRLLEGPGCGEGGADSGVAERGSGVAERGSGVAECGSGVAERGSSVAGRGAGSGVAGRGAGSGGAWRGAGGDSATDHGKRQPVG